VGSDSTRLTAYAEMVAGLLDTHDPGAAERFDEVLADAEASGLIDSDTARALRWWQRESLRGLVAHAQTVLPQTLLAIERAHHEARDRLEPTEWPAVRSPDAEVADEIDDEPVPPADLTARRLLVAGLTPLRDP
jgi:hypothetical protein